MKLGTTHHRRTVSSNTESQGSRPPPIAFSEINLKKILVPVDFSDCSRKALHYAVTLAKQFKAEILLLHVVVLVPPPPDVVVLETDAFAEKSHGESAKHLSQWRRMAAAKASVKIDIRQGMIVHQEIVTAAREWNGDLIVIGNQGRAALARILMGSTAERVVRHAPCPVLVIRMQEHDFLTDEGGVSASKIRRKNSRTISRAEYSEK